TTMRGMGTDTLAFVTAGIVLIFVISGRWLLPFPLAVPGEDLLGIPRHPRKNVIDRGKFNVLALALGQLDQVGELEANRIRNVSLITIGKGRLVPAEGPAFACEMSEDVEPRGRTIPDAEAKSLGDDTIAEGERDALPATFIGGADDARPQ